MKHLSCLLAFCSLSSVAYAGSSDSGVIKALYSDAAGNLAVQLDNGFPNAIAAHECVTNNGWAGVVIANSDPILRATLLAAKASQSPVQLSTNGCEAGGSWLKILAVYVN